MEKKIDSQKKQLEELKTLNSSLAEKTAKVEKEAEELRN
jgi:uncharacterized coiled-coil protein SlyX